MFSNVLKKFFTGRALYENNQATQDQEDAMVAQVKDIVTRSRATLIEDLVGVIALFATLYGYLAFSAF
ncbi:MAG: hypothetical protein ACK4RZ_14670 [Paracoccaceae bacterium]